MTIGIHRIRLAVYLACAFALATHCAAQVQVAFAAIDPYQFGPTTFLSATLTNPATPVKVRLRGDVLADGGVHVLKFRSAPILVPSGSFRVVRMEYTMEQFQRTNDTRYFSLGMDQRLVAGIYSFCVTAEPVGEDEVMSPFCDSQEVEDLLFMDLVSPANGDTIDEVRPALNWMLTGGTLPPTQRARLSLTPKIGRVDAYQAQALSKPLFMLDTPRPGVVGFPGVAPDLERGKCYSWQVERSSNGLVIDRTEAWSFCVRDRRPISPDRYVRVGPYITDAVTDAKDEMLHLLCDEGSGTAPLDVRIIMPQGGTLSSTNAQQGHGAPEIRNVGTHLFEVDLQSCQLKSGEYVLILLEAGRELGKLRFRIAS